VPKRPSKLVFVPCKPFQPRLIFAGKARSLPWRGGPETVPKRPSEMGFKLFVTGRPYQTRLFFVGNANSIREPERCSAQVGSSLTLF